MNGKDFEELIKWLLDHGYNYNDPRVVESLYELIDIWEDSDNEWFEL